jgi:phosphate acetyltransferase
VVVDPDEDELVDIALASARTWRALFDAEPRIAALSFSTRGSADHPAARRMAVVAGRLTEAGLSAEGELQVDAALVEAVAAQKSPGGAVAGRADVLLFPDLQSGNIGYKLVQRLAGWRAIGPLVQGLARPVFDLSRGCSASEIVDTVAIAILTAEPQSK